MSSILSLWPWALALAVLLFWCVGAFSRVHKMRTAITMAFSALTPVWQRRLAWVQARALLSSEGGQRLSAARSQCELILEMASKRPFDATRIQTLSLAASTLEAAWMSVESDPESLAPVTNGEPGGLTWDALGHQAMPLQMAFNTQVSRYNHAIALFPTSLMALTMRFKRAKPLPIPEGRT